MVEASGKVIVNFKDVATDEGLREHLEQRCRNLAQEFPETTHYELTLSPDSKHIAAHAHVSGKNTQVASHATSEDPRQAADRALDKLERELRRVHDKRIFGQRREAQKTRGKRSS